MSKATREVRRRVNGELELSHHVSASRVWHLLASSRCEDRLMRLGLEKTNYSTFCLNAL